MEATVVTIRVDPDALVKVYDETNDEIIYIDNTDQNGTSAPIKLDTQGGHYFIDVTIFPQN